MMIQIDKTDFLYKMLQKLGVDSEEIDNKYIEFASYGVTNIKDFNNYLLSALEVVDDNAFDEADLEEVADYYYDLKKVKKIPKTKFVAMLKEYKQTPTVELNEQLINSQLKDVLLIACQYKITHNDLNLSDLVQVGNLGLITALDKYNVDSKVAFETYLNYWVLDAINKEFTQGEKNG